MQRMMTTMMWKWMVAVLMWGWEWYIIRSTNGTQLITCHQPFGDTLLVILFMKTQFNIVQEWDILSVRKGFQTNGTIGCLCIIIAVYYIIDPQSIHSFVRLEAAVSRVDRRWLLHSITSGDSMSLSQNGIVGFRNVCEHIQRIMNWVMMICDYHLWIMDHEWKAHTLTFNTDSICNFRSAAVISSWGISNDVVSCDRCPTDRCILFDVTLDVGQCNQTYE